MLTQPILHIVCIVVMKVSNSGQIKWAADTNPGSQKPDILAGVKPQLQLLDIP